MRKNLLLLLAIVIVLCFASTSNHSEHVKIRNGTKVVYDDTQVQIDDQDMVLNATGSQCGWAALETLARYNHILSLYDITKNKEGILNESSAIKELRERKINYIYQRENNKKDTHILEEYVCVRKYGAAIGIKKTHMIVLCHFDKYHNKVKVIDNIGPKALKIQTWDMDKFLELWDGCAYVIIPDDKPNNPNIR